MPNATAKKPRVKKERKRKQQNLYYFTQDTENAIVQYVEEKNEYRRNQIFNAQIKYSLDKLAENIINTFKFPYYNESYKDTKAEVVSFLILNLDKYKADKGKAFSYFSTVAKNYLININNNNYKKLKMQLLLSKPDGDGSGTEASTSTASEKDIELEDTDYTNEMLNNDLVVFISELLEYFEGNLAKIFNKERDIAIANEILKLCRSYQNIENFNKKFIYVLIKEMTESNAALITSVLNKLREHYKELKQEFLTTGTVI